MSIVGISMWYGDAGKHLADRAMHLLRKVAVDRWIWSVRPTNDPTQFMLDAVARHCQADVEIIVEDWPQVDHRLERLSKAGDNALDHVRDSETHVLWHESDLFSEDAVAVRMGETSLPEADAPAAIGGWPWLSHCPHDDGRALGIKTPKKFGLDEPIFYDTWGYRKDGRRFANKPPYHECYRADEPFRLDSVGSVVLLDAEYLRRGCRMNGNGLVGLCDAMRAAGGEVWCDPRIPIVQPFELWSFNDD